MVDNSENFWPCWPFCSGNSCGFYWKITQCNKITIRSPIMIYNQAKKNKLKMKPYRNRNPKFWQMI